MKNSETSRDWDGLLGGKKGGGRRVDIKEDYKNLELEPWWWNVIKTKPKKDICLNNKSEHIYIIFGLLKLILPDKIFVSFYHL